MQDVQVTWECFQHLRDRYVLHALEETPLGKILSEASLGKAYLRQMGVRPFREVQPDFPPHLTGLIMSTYYGGRAEVHWRRELRQVLYCDFLSMYPTVCTLMGLWRFVIAQGMEWSDSTEKTRALVDSISLGRFTAARVLAAADDHCSGRAASRHFSGPRQIRRKIADHRPELFNQPIPLWFTLADVITAKLRTGNRRKLSRPLAFAERAATRLAGNIDRRQSRLSR